MTKQLEALLASEIADFFAGFVEIHTEIGGPNTVEEAQQQLTERVTRIASECESALIAALEQAQQHEEVAELLRDKVKRLESDVWDSQQLVKVKSENQYELKCKVRELEQRNDKSNIAWSRREDAALEKLEAAEKRIAELGEEQKEFAEALGCSGDNESILEAIDGLKTQVREIDMSNSVLQHQFEASPLAVKLHKRSVGEVMHMSGFSRDYAEGWCAGNDNAIHEIRAAGGTVSEGE